MKRKNILAHRGIWVRPEEKNTYVALVRALKLGFGLETDLRDLAGKLVVSHDPPSGRGILLAEQLFSAYSRINSGARLALNIKADGLQTMITQGLVKAGILKRNVFAFDASIPDALGYLDRGFPVYSRQSEYELEPAYLNRAAGVWIDNFSGKFRQVEEALELLEAGHRVALVSPELHNRNPAPCWTEVRSAGLHNYPNFELCTDLPEAALEAFGDEQ